MRQIIVIILFLLSCSTGIAQIGFQMVPLVFWGSRDVDITITDDVGSQTQIKYAYGLSGIGIEFGPNYRIKTWELGLNFSYFRVHNILKEEGGGHLKEPIEKHNRLAFVATKNINLHEQVLIYPKISVGMDLFDHISSTEFSVGIGLGCLYEVDHFNAIGLEFFWGQLVSKIYTPQGLDTIGGKQSYDFITIGLSYYYHFERKGGKKKRK